VLRSGVEKLLGLETLCLLKRLLPDYSLINIPEGIAKAQSIPNRIAVEETR
jgi:hypothetical protein